MKTKTTFKTLICLFLATLSIIPCKVEAQEKIRELTNLVIFVRFADDEEIDHSFADIDSMFNGRTPGYLSVYNFYDALSYGKIHYNTYYTNNIQNGVIISYTDTMPRCYFQPYDSIVNPIGYHPWEQPFMGVSMREAQLLGRIIHYVDSMHLVDSDMVLDGDGDGDIDNISFIAKGDVGEWASILWPHMEFFPHDSLDYTVTLNGLRPNTFNLEFEDAGPDIFSAHVFRHEMGHSLKMPDLYHYVNYTNITPAHTWDMMGYNYAPNHTAAIYKHKILHVCDAPIEITTDGDYTLHSVGSSSSQNCYYIRSSIDSNQWFVFEYRRRDDLFESGIPGTGLVVARWNDTVPINYDGMFANAFFDFHTKAHQYWIFRPGSDIDTVNGEIYLAFFSQVIGCTTFGPDTDPHPYLTDGTPETSFEITNIHANGTKLTFHVHFLNSTGIDAIQSSQPVIYAKDGRIFVDTQTPNSQKINVFDMMGRCVSSTTSNGTQTSMHVASAGVYIVKVGDCPAQRVVVMR